VRFFTRTNSQDQAGTELMRFGRRVCAEEHAALSVERM
jgi:hypothetical protein